jgi:hypothetical protein
MGRTKTMTLEERQAFVRAVQANLEHTGRKCWRTPDPRGPQQGLRSGEPVRPPPPRLGKHWRTRIKDAKDSKGSKGSKDEVS